ncbi:MAG: hypothetical protein ACK5KN_11530 [Dysgonomonas sp.]|uniref:hypothetical protein n=1 Tax=Dysgonomonas sp. TaxID=1891233 RepID=UPI003A86CDD9
MPLSLYNLNPSGRGSPDNLIQWKRLSALRLLFQLLLPVCDKRTFFRIAVDFTNFHTYGSKLYATCPSNHSYGFDRNFLLK